MIFRHFAIIAVLFFTSVPVFAINEKQNHDETTRVCGKALEKNGKPDLLEKTIDKGYALLPGKSRLHFLSKGLDISVDYRLGGSGKDDIKFKEIWFEVNIGRPLTKDEISKAIALFKGESSPDYAQTIYAATSHYSETKQIEREIDPDAIIPTYEFYKSEMASIDDKTPTTSINDNILDEGPISLPEHKWRWIFMAFDAQNPKRPDLGFTWNSIVLFRDGFKLRIAKPANLIHAISPAITKIVVEGNASDADLKHPEMQETIVNELQKEGVKTIGDVFARMQNAHTPKITSQELAKVTDYVSEMLGYNIRETVFTVKADF